MTLSIKWLLIMSACVMLHGIWNGDNAQAGSLNIEQPGTNPSPLSLPSALETAALPPPSPVWRKIIMKQIAPCWRPIMLRGSPTKTEPVPFVIDAVKDRTGAIQIAPKSSAPNQIPPVFMLATLDRSGNVIQVELTEESKANFYNYPDYRNLATEVMKGVGDCSPIKGLPDADYNAWKTLPLEFELRPSADIN